MEKKAELVEASIDNGGYKFKIDPQKLDDIEVIEALSDGKQNNLLPVIKGIIGDDEFANIKAYYVSKHGRMSITTDLTEVVEAIFTLFPKSQA